MNICAVVSAVVSLAVFSACAPERPAPGFGDAQYELKVFDRPAEARFSLILSSKDNRDICVSTTVWPDRDGGTQTGRDVYSLETDRGTMFPHPPTMFADCWGAGCETRLRPGESIEGFIAYSEFGDPADIKALRKRELHVDIVPAVCESITRETRRDAAPSIGSPKAASSPKSAKTPQKN